MPPRRASGVDQTAVRLEVLRKDHPQNIPDPGVAQVACHPRRAKEPFAVKLVGHQAFVLLCTGTPKVVIFSVPQALFKGNKTFFKQVSPAFGACGVACRIGNPGGGFQRGKPQNRNVDRRTGKIPGVIGVAFCVAVGQTVAVRIQFADGIHGADHMRPHVFEIVPVSGIKVVAQDHQHKLIVHIHAFIAVAHMVQIRGEEMVHASVRALEGGAHTHLFQLQLREEGQQTERRMIGDVCCVEAAEAQALPETELAAF